MQLKGLEKALQEGCKLHGFRSGGGLRVIRIEDGSGVCKAYGEHPNVEDALSHANEDYLAGGRDYGEVYGKLKPHYLTGSSSSTSNLDSWLLRGKSLDSYFKDGEFVVELRGCATVETPQEVVEKVNQTKKPVTWKSRGYTYETSLGEFPSGKICYNTSVIEVPKGRSDSDGWMYQIMKVGKAKKFFKAVENAFKAEEIERLDDEN